MALEVQHPFFGPRQRLLIGEAGDEQAPAVVGAARLPLVGADDEHRGAHAKLLQNGRGDGQIAGIAVVHGNEHRLVRQRRACLHIVDDLGDGDCVEACVPQGGHLLPEPFGRYDGAVEALRVEMVVHQHRQVAGAVKVPQTHQIGDLKEQKERQEKDCRLLPASFFSLHNGMASKGMSWLQVQGSTIPLCLTSVNSRRTSGRMALDACEYRLYMPKSAATVFSIFRMGSW